MSDVVVTSNGKYFVTSESEQVLVWNLSHRVVLHKDSQPNVTQVTKGAFNKTGLMLGNHPCRDMRTHAYYDLTHP